MLVLALAAGAVACVPAARHEEVKSALRAEQQANRRATARFYEIQHRLTELEASVREREARLAQHETRLAESALDAKLASTERDAAAGMVEQLRGELARVGDHLRTFSDQKQALAEALNAAEARSKRLEQAERVSAELSATVRDLALTLHEPLVVGELELGVREGKTVVTMPRSKLVTSGEVHEAGTKLIARLAKVAALHPKSRIELASADASEPTAADANKPAEPTDAADVGLDRVREALVAAGVAADRVSIARGQSSSESLRIAFTAVLD